MKNKIKPLLLVTALMLSPIAQTGGVYASEVIPQQEITETNKDYEANHDAISGDVVLNDNTTDAENKTKEDEVTKIENKVQSSNYNGKMTIVDANDEEAGANYITVVSNNSDNKPLKGFKYRLINDDTKEEVVLDFEEKTELIAKVPDGSYTIKFVSGPKENDHEKYTVEEDIKLTLPKEDKDGSIIKEAKVMLKHSLVKEKSPTNPKTMDDKNIITPILLIVGAILIGAFLISRKEKDEETVEQA